MAKTLFIVQDDVFDDLPEAVQKKLVSEAKKIFSFVPLNVEARRPSTFPATLHFTDSVVKLVTSDDEVGGASSDIQRQEDLNIRFSITQRGIRLRLNPLTLSQGGDPDRGGLGGSWKTTVVEGGGARVSITMTYGVASIESAGQSVVEEMLNGRTLEEIRQQRRKAIEKQGLGFYGTHKALISTREETETELPTKPLKYWPADQVANVATALARLIAHEARHQYVEAHSARGLGADSPRIFGDKNFEQFDGTDKANVKHAISQLETEWKRASVHLETCPQGQQSPFA